MKVLLVAAAALIRRQAGVSQVLLAQRPVGKPLAGLWEFPGGKVEEGEVPEACLVRELSEELSITVAECDCRPLTFASHPLAEGRHLLMPLWECARWKGDPIGAEGQELAWVTAEELSSYEMPPADEPLLPHVQRAMAELQRDS
jgi:8-oxo-dGTP diphosphatase